MALRAGYYGLKRGIRDKLLDAVPAGIGPDNPIASKSDVTATVDLLKDTTGWTGKNKNKFKINTQESHGVTVTRNADDTYTFTGENDSNIFQFFFFQRVGTNNLELPAGRYVLVGGDSQIYVKISKTVNNAAQVIAAASGNAVEFDYSGNDAPYGFYLEVQAPVGTTFNKTISVMITTPEEYALSPSYEPYHESVELSKYNRSEANILGAKNLWEVTITSQSLNGLDFTVYADGSIKVNGTATADTFFSTWADATNKLLTKGKYILNGCPNGGSSSTYALWIRLRSAGTTNPYAYFSDYGNGISVNIEDGWEGNITLDIKNGQTINNLIFKPMLRLATDTDSDFTPYAMTNRELTEKVNDITPKVLPNNADLNNYLSEGDYICDANLYTYTNIPSAINSTSFRLKIMPFNVSASRCVQIIIVNKAEPEVYMRTNYASTWQSWYKFTGTEVTPPATQSVSPDTREASDPEPEPATREASEPAELPIEEEPVTVKKTTRKKSTAAADTEKEGD